EMLVSASTDAGELEKAVVYAGEAARLQPDSVETASRHGAALLRVQKHAEAEAAFRRALSLSPRHAASQTGLALSLAGAGQRQEAEGLLRACIADNPTHDHAYVALGTLLGQQERFVEAADIFR